MTTVTIATSPVSTTSATTWRTATRPLRNCASATARGRPRARSGAASTSSFPTDASRAFATT
ncbi:UNVERIFIED_CONTAM: hypothetical protein GTU68_023004 [Idotea baltica]|nr:hypothetical protein [Idotea baltica]